MYAIYLHLQILLQGCNIPICLGRHSGSRTAHTNSDDLDEHFESTKYLKWSNSIDVNSFFWCDVVKSYCKIPRHISSDVDLQFPLTLAESLTKTLLISGIIDGSVGETNSSKPLFVGNFCNKNCYIGNISY